jgi:hypothetical protein
MSGDEKAEQIGRAVTEYQTAKVELAHLEQKIRKIGEAYTEVGQALSERSSMRDFKIEGGHFHFLYRRTENENLAASLLNEQALVAVIIERDSARKRVSELRSRLNALGITNLE